jgi:hypothetical protein
MNKRLEDIHTALDLMFAGQASIRGQEITDAVFQMRNWRDGATLSAMGYSHDIARNWANLRGVVVLTTWAAIQQRREHEQAESERTA